MPLVKLFCCWLELSFLPWRFILRRLLAPKLSNAYPKKKFVSVSSSMCCRSQCTDVVGPAVPLSLLSCCCISHVIICYAPLRTVALALSLVALYLCLSMALFCIYIEASVQPYKDTKNSFFLLRCRLLPCAVGASCTLSTSPVSRPQSRFTSAPIFDPSSVYRFP